MRNTIKIITLSCVLLEGCASQAYYSLSKDNKQFIDGVTLQNENQFDNYTKTTTSFLKKIKELVGIQGSVENQEDAKKLTAAGFLYVDSLCNQYFTILERLNRSQIAATSESTVIGTFTSALMTAARASSASIGVVATAFGSSNTYIEADSKRYLYDNSPNETRALVATIQSTFRSGINFSQNPTDGEVYGYIQAYASNCTPVVIDSYVKQAIANGQSILSKTQSPGVAPNAIIAPSPSAVANAVVVNAAATAAAAAAAPVAAAAAKAEATQAIKNEAQKAVEDNSQAPNK